jgi:putative peptide zinc metalloprotease protein
LTLRHWGGVVPQWGVSWWLFTPVPFVDASSATALPQRHQRAAVAAAGIMVELALAAVALAVALALQPGRWRDAALVVVFVGGLSSLLVNANPFMRFDGYHVLCDVLDLPNLATRSRRFWLDWVVRWGLRLPERPDRLEPLPGERWALWLYAPLAWGMRLSVWWAVWVWMAGVSAVLGGGAALYGAWAVLGQPLWAGWRWWRQQAWTPRLLRQAQQRLVLVAVLGGVLVCGVPLPDTTVVQGVVWLSDEAWVRVGTEGFVEAVLVAPGSQVEVGQPLLRLQSPALQVEQERLQSKVEALVAGRFQALQHDAARAGVVEHELQATQAELERVEERLAQLWVRAERAGRVALPQAQDLPGRYLARGARLGHVETGEPTRVRVVIPQERAALVLAQPGPVSVWRVEAGLGPRPRAWPATLVGTPSGGGVTLPSDALGDRHGGDIAVDPADPKGLRPLWPVLQADVQLQASPEVASAAPSLIGARVWVRFEHARRPLAWQWSRSVQQQVLHHLNPSQ